MFGISRKKDPYVTIVCKGLKIDGLAAHALKIDALDLPAIIKAACESPLCAKVSFGRIYQKPGSMFDEHKIEDQDFSARYDKGTKSISMSLRQGLMRQMVVIVTREPLELSQAIGLPLEPDPPPETPPAS